MQKAVIFKSQGETIFASIGIPHEGAGCVIMSHGMEGSKDERKWLLLADKLYRTGFAYLRFNYRGCGEGKEASQGNLEDTTLSSRIRDFRAAVDFALTTGVNENRLAAVGSSLGGTVAVVAYEGRIKAMALLATPCRFRIPLDEMYEVYKGERFFKLPSGSKIKKNFFDDIGNYDICAAVERINCPLLVIHGDADNLVPFENGQRIYERANEPKRLEIIKGGNHGFDEPHHMEQITKLTLDWFKQYISQ